MSLIEVVADELDALGVEVPDVPLFVFALTLGYQLGRDAARFLKDDDAVRDAVRRKAELGTVGCRPPLSERPSTRLRS